LHIFLYFPPDLVPDIVKKVVFGAGSRFLKNPSRSDIIKQLGRWFWG